MERIVTIVLTVLCASGMVAKATNRSLASSGDRHENHYLDMRERIDHLEEKLDSATWKLDKLQTEMSDKMDRVLSTIKLQPTEQQHREKVEIGRIELQSKTEVNATRTPFCNVNPTFESQIEQLSQRTDVCIRVSEIISDRNLPKDAPYPGEASPHEWIVIMRRVTGRVNFSRDWDEYKSGFGDLGGEFWIGLEDIHQLTSRRSHRLRVVLTDFSGEVKFAEYTDFLVRGEDENYRLHVTGYVKGSTAGDSLAYHNGMDFTTQDRDNDQYSKNCAILYKGAGWWYTDCARSLLTGQYLQAGDRSGTGVRWQKAYNDARSFKAAEMSIRET